MLKRVWQKWMRIALVIGNFNSRVILTIIYATCILPFGIVVRLFGDPLCIKSKKTSTWSNIENPTRSLEDGKRQF